MSLKLPQLETLTNQLWARNAGSEPAKGTARVVVVGVGFGGLHAVRELANQPQVRLTVIDRNNYHGFWPLLYQVATAGLVPDAIAFPVREMFHHYNNVQFQMAEVKKVDLANRRLELNSGDPVEYDYLVLAAGSANNYFGNQTIAANTYSLKDVDEAVGLRQGILDGLEQAVLEKDEKRRAKLLTFVIVGAGPTGVELAGTLAELICPLIRKDYPTLDEKQFRLIVVEAHHTLLKPFPSRLQKVAQHHLEKMGVEIRPDSKVKTVKDGLISFDDGSTLEAGLVVWAAGVKAGELGQSLGIQLAHGGQVPVEPTLNLKNHPEVFVVGDMAYLQGYQDGKEAYPQVAPVAIQQGRLAGKNILAALRGQPCQPFHYLDKGNMSTIGRRDAVVYAFGIQLSGQLAWLTWLVVHLYYLVGVRNRILTMAAWAYNYFTYNQGARLIGKQKSDHQPQVDF